MGLTTINFESIYLHRNTSVNVFMPYAPRKGMTPREFYESGKKFKVLWLLHGGMADNSDWSRKSNIEVYAKKKGDLIVVMPDAMNSTYQNYDLLGGYNWPDFFFKELMPMIYGWFPASRKREDNFIAGMSMGGVGTCICSLMHPELFSKVAVLSSAPMDFDKKEFYYEHGNDIQRRILEAYHGDEKAARASYSNTWDRFLEIKGRDDLPSFYFSSGDKDMHHESIWMTFRKYAEENGLPIEFCVMPGYAHEWPLWDVEIKKFVENLY